MKRFPCIAMVSILALSGLPAAALAQGVGVPVQHVDEAAAGAPLSPRDRGELARQFVRKWGEHVEGVYDIQVGIWARRMVPTFVAADPDNFRNALKRATFEGAMAELAGRGAQLDDQRALTRLAKAAQGAPNEVAGKLLGDVTGDLTFTPLQPCRIVDTRNTVAGAIAGNSTRSFSAQAASFAAQGGVANDCGLAAVSMVGAIAINVTAVTPGTAGFATVYPFGTAQPLASSVNYSAGAIVNNAIVTRVPSPAGSSDFTVFSFAQSHYVIDLVGYFAPPQVTQLQCVNTSLTTFTAPANTSTFFLNPQCPLGYRPVTPYCYSGTPGVNNQGSGLAGNLAGNQDTFCAWFNSTNSPQSVLGGNICCRIPGR